MIQIRTRLNKRRKGEEGIGSRMMGHKQSIVNKVKTMKRQNHNTQSWVKKNRISSQGTKRRSSITSGGNRHKHSGGYQHGSLSVVVNIWERAR